MEVDIFIILILIFLIEEVFAFLYCVFLCLIGKLSDTTDLYK